jgi:hypothetical protein
MYIMNRVVQVLVALLTLMTQSFLPPKAKLLKVTLSVTVLIVEPHRSLWLRISSWLRVHSWLWVSTHKLHGLCYFGFRLWRVLPRRIWECINFVSQVVGFFHPNSSLRWFFW